MKFFINNTDSVKENPIVWTMRGSEFKNNQALFIHHELMNLEFITLILCSIYNSKSSF